MRRVVVIALLGLSLGACAKPDMRSAVYEAFGPQYAVMKPALQRPAPTDPAYTNNEYRYIPGHLTIPKFEVKRDDNAKRSAVWRVNQAREDCSPSGKLYHLSDLWAIPQLPVHIEYRLDSRRLFIPEMKMDREIKEARTAAKKDLKLRDNDLRHVNLIRINISNVTLHFASDGTLDSALTDIRSRCGRFFAKVRGVEQVQAILAGDVSIEIDALEGSSIDVGFLKARILTALSERIGGQSAFFAVATRPIKLR